jgi:hypothetical protein
VQESLLNDEGLKNYAALAISEPYARTIDGSLVTVPMGHHNWTKLITARTYAASQFSIPSAYNFSDTSNQKEYMGGERGQAKFAVGDFFTKDWEAGCCSDGEEFTGFDLIYDYTVSLPLMSAENMCS